jgi:hypothetical protein
VTERVGHPPLSWASLTASLALVSCGGSGSSPDEVLSCLDDAGVEAGPLVVGETERQDYGVKDEIRINLGHGRGATIYFFDSGAMRLRFRSYLLPGLRSDTAMRAST